MNLACRELFECFSAMKPALRFQTCRLPEEEAFEIAQRAEQES